MEPSSMVRKTPLPTMMTVFRKNAPMWPAPQARPKLSQCSAFGISESGSLRICASSLNAESTTHSSGKTTIAPHASRKTWENPLKIESLAGLPTFGRRLAVAGGGLASATATFFSISAVLMSGPTPSELQPLAAGYPQLKGGENHGENAQRDPHRARVAVAATPTAVESGEVEDRGEDLAGVVGATLARGHHEHEGVHVQRDETEVHPRDRYGVAQQWQRDPEERGEPVGTVEECRFVDVPGDGLHGRGEQHQVEA